MKNKKAVSAVVATVLIILITVAAITIIWATIIPMVRDNLAGSTTCMDATTDLEIITSQGYTCKKSDGTVSVQVRRGAKSYNLTKIDILISESGSTNTFHWTENLPGANEEKTNVTNDEVDYSNAESVKIAPILKIGNEEVSCDPSATVALSPCI